MYSTLTLAIFYCSYTSLYFSPHANGRQSLCLYSIGNFNIHFNDTMDSIPFPIIFTHDFHPTQTHKMLQECKVLIWTILKTLDSRGISVFLDNFYLLHPIILPPMPVESKLRFKWHQEYLYSHQWTQTLWIRHNISLRIKIEIIFNFLLHHCLIQLVVLVPVGLSSLLWHHRQVLFVGCQSFFCCPAWTVDFWSSNN